MKTSAALLIFALSISRASAFKPVVKSSDGNINIDSMDVRVKLRGLEAEFTLSSLFEGAQLFCTVPTRFTTFNLHMCVFSLQGH